jgi:O-antigen ligase
VIAYLNATITTLKKLYKLLVLLEKLSLFVAVATILVFVSERVRVELSTNNPNYLAFFLGIGFSISLFMRKKSKVATVILIAIAIIMTGSRIIIISSFIIGIIKLFSNKRSWFVNLIVALLLSVVILPVINTDSLLDTKRFSKIDEDASAILRVEIIEASKGIVMANPFNGLGYGQFQVRFLDYASKNSRFLIDVEQIVTHNDYMRIVDELGIPAAIFFIGMLVREALLVLKMRGSLRLLAGSLFITVLLYSTSHNNLNTYMCWFFIMIPSFVYRLAYKPSISKGDGSSNVENTI